MDLPRGRVLPDGRNPVELPLRDRAEDIPELVQHFFRNAKDEQGRPRSRAAGLLPRFQDYRWPENPAESRRSS